MLLNLFGRTTAIGRLRYNLERNYSLIIRILLVVICIGFTLLSAYLLRTSNLIGLDFLPGMMPVIAIGGLAVMVVFYNHMQTAVLLVVVISTLVADGLGTGTGTKITFTFVLLNLLTVVWLFRMLIVERSLSVRLSPANIPAVIFMVLVVVATFWSSIYVDREVSYAFRDRVFPRLMTMVVLIISPMTYLLFANNIKSVKAIKFIIWWFIIIGAVFVVLRLGTGSVPAPMNARGQFPTWVCVFAIGQAMFNQDLRRIVRLALLGISAGWFYVTIGLGVSWLSGWLPQVVIVTALVFLYSRRWFLVLLIAGAIYATINTEVIDAIIVDETAESGDTRAEAWQNALRVYDQHYLFGTGPAGYVFYLQTYLRGYFNLSHNNYIDILSQTGIFGFLSFVGIWIGVAIVAVRTYLKIPRGGFRQAAAASLLAANASTFVTMMLGDWVTPFTYTQGLDGIDYTIWAWVIAGLTIALYHLTVAENEAAEQAQANTVSIVPSNAARTPQSPKGAS